MQKEQLLRFDILISEEGAQGQPQIVPVLFNVNHIVSIKPIRLNISGRIVEGHWIRLTNGKKYRAVVIPTEIKKLLAGERHNISDLTDAMDDSQIALQ